MLHHVLAGIAALLCLVAGAFALRAPAWPVAFATPVAGPQCIGRSVFEIETFRAAGKHAHVLTAVTLRDGRLRAIWYEGTNELNPDVRLWTAIYDGKQWSEPRVIMGPAEASAGSGRFVRKVGNAVVYRDGNGDLAMVFATGFVGGWDSVNLKMTRSSDDGETWQPAENLTTSPLFNLGTNVRNHAVPAANGMTIMPASRELLGTFPTTFLLDRNGRVVGERRIAVNFSARQPFVSVEDRTKAVALSRTSEQYTLISRTTDAGDTWSDMAATNLPNYQTPVSIERFGDVLMAAATVKNPATGLWQMQLVKSVDGGATWSEVFSRDFGRSSREIPKYPWLMPGPGNLYHLLFTLTRSNATSELIHIRMSRDWIADRGVSPCP